MPGVLYGYGVTSSSKSVRLAATSLALGFALFALVRVPPSDASTGSVSPESMVPANCITAIYSPSMNTCPSGSPEIVAASGTGVGVNAEGTVWGQSSTPISTLSGVHLVAPIVGAEESPRAGPGGSNACWLVAADGGVFSFSGAQFWGSMGGHPLNRPVVAMAATPDAGGYWLVGADGGVFTFGDAHFYGSMGGQPLNSPVVGIVPTHDGSGYWLVAADGGVFAFGDAPFYGSMAGLPAGGPIVGMALDDTGAGYWLATADGSILTFGDAPFFGSASGVAWSPVIAISEFHNVASAYPAPDTESYFVVTKSGQIYEGSGPISG
jgi:hypothetical protein